MFTSLTNKAGIKWLLFSTVNSVLTQISMISKNRTHQVHKCWHLGIRKLCWLSILIKCPDMFQTCLCFGAHSVLPLALFLSLPLPLCPLYRPSLLLFLCTETRRQMWVIAAGTGGYCFVDGGRELRKADSITLLCYWEHTRTHKHTPILKHWHSQTRYSFIICTTALSHKSSFHLSMSSVQMAVTFLH